jgi:putative ABC transport system substrate-binding protein
MQAALRASGQHVEVIEATSVEDIERAFARLSEQRPDALLVGADPLFSSRREQIVGLAARHRIPAMYEWPEYVAVGGLMSYGPSLRDAYRQVGVYVGRVLSGAKPADLPIQQPTRFELLINMKAAKGLGLSIPQVLLDRADEVIE